MSQDSSQLAVEVRQLKAQRKEGDIDLKTYYQGLLRVVSELAKSLADEVPHMPDEEVIAQVPLILLFLEEQIRKFADRS